MPKLQKQTKPVNSFLINDNGKLVTIKQPTIADLQIFYQAIIANKQVVNKVFGLLF